MLLQDVSTCLCGSTSPESIILRTDHIRNPMLHLKFLSDQIYAGSGFVANVACGTDATEVDKDEEVESTIDDGEASSSL